MPSHERSLQTEVVVLRHANWGEADRILTLFSDKAGKIRAVAKGARKLRSRKAGHLEPFTRVKLMLARGREFWIVTQAETVDAYLTLREDLVKTAYAAYIVELLDRFTYEEGANRPLYQLLVEMLERINQLDDAFPAVRYYEIHLLDQMGFRPELTRCVRCGAEIMAQDQYLDAAMGGVVCPRCGSNVSTGRRITMQTLKFLRHYQRSHFTEATRIPLPPEVRPEMENILAYYLTYWLERNVNSAAFLREVRRDSHP